VRKIHTSDAKEVNKKGQAEPKGEQLKKAQRKVNRLACTAMAGKMDESKGIEWRRIHV
jgi:hypothetical protein